MAPKLKVKEEKYPRPSGRARKGTVWNSQTGKYEDEHEQAVVVEDTSKQSLNKRQRDAPAEDKKEKKHNVKEDDEATDVEEVSELDTLKLWAETYLQKANKKVRETLSRLLAQEESIDLMDDDAINKLRKKAVEEVGVDHVQRAFNCLIKAAKELKIYRKQLGESSSA